MIQTNLAIAPQSHFIPQKRVFVYGTLKSQYGNNRLLVPYCHLIDSNKIVHGYKLYYSSSFGFPVAKPSPEDSVKGELWELPEHPASVIASLDWLEAEGKLYKRIEVEEGTYMYVGMEVWNFPKLMECPRDAEGIFFWDRKNEN